MKAGSALATYNDFAEWQLHWAQEQIEREEEFKTLGEGHQAAVFEMKKTLLLCCPEDHRCKGNCKAAKTLCRMCELPVCVDCLYALQRKQVSPMAHE